MAQTPHEPVSGDGPSFQERILANPAAAAAEHGLVHMGVRPTLRAYIRSTWRQRHFVHSLALSRAYVENQHSYLGQLWSVLTPTLNATVYVIIFGGILKAGRGLDNTIAFIVIGTFLYRFFNESVSSGARAVTRNMNLVRSLHFPRSVLPLSEVLSLLASMIPTVAVMLVFTLASGLFPNNEPIEVSARWLLLIPAIGLLTLFNAGVAFMVARWAAMVPDLLNTIPFVLRLLMYASGVLFPISNYFDGALAAVLDYQPIAVYLNLGRQALMTEPSIPLDPWHWAAGAAWGVGTFIIGFIIFWRAEARYGRE